MSELKPEKQLTVYPLSQIVQSKPCNKELDTLMREVCTFQS